MLGGDEESVMGSSDKGTQLPGKVPRLSRCSVRIEHLINHACFASLIETSCSAPFASSLDLPPAQN
jgi:hypothetical protein